MTTSAPGFKSVVSRRQKGNYSLTSSLTKHLPVNMFFELRDPLPTHTLDLGSVYNLADSINGLLVHK